MPVKKTTQFQQLPHNRQSLGTNDATQKVAPGTDFLQRGTGSASMHGDTSASGRFLTREQTMESQATDVYANNQNEQQVYSSLVEKGSTAIDMVVTLSKDD